MKSDENMKPKRANSHSNWKFFCLSLSGFGIYIFLISLFLELKVVEQYMLIYRRLSWLLCDIAIIVPAVGCPITFCIGLFRKDAMFLRLAQVLGLLLLVLVFIKMCLLVFVSQPNSATWGM